MCGRYLLTHSAADIAAFFRAIPAPAEYASGGNISPMQQIVVVTGGDEPRLTTMRWGMTPPWSGTRNSGRPIINARSETVTQKPMFRDLLPTHRCIVPASGYYEWPRNRPPRSTPFEIAYDDGNLMAMAALWSNAPTSDGQSTSCVIITTAPAPEIAEIHDRMPALLPQAAVDIWLDQKTSVPDAVALLRPWQYDRLTATNNTRRSLSKAESGENRAGVSQQLDLWEDF